MTTAMKEEKPDFGQMVRYAQLAMKYTESKSPDIARQLREIEKELNMSAEEIMDEVMRHTEIFAVH